MKSGPTYDRPVGSASLCATLLVTTPYILYILGMGCTAECIAVGQQLGFSGARKKRGWIPTWTVSH